jgi:hypothetical protein
VTKELKPVRLCSALALGAQDLFTFTQKIRTQPTVGLLITSKRTGGLGVEL